MIYSEKEVEKLLRRIKIIAAPFMKIYALVIAEDGYDMIVDFSKAGKLIERVRASEGEIVTQKKREMAEGAEVGEYRRVARVLIGRIFHRLNIGLANTYNAVRVEKVRFLIIPQRRLV